MEILPMKSLSANGYPPEYIAFRALGFSVDDATILVYSDDLSSVEYYCYNDSADEND